MPFRWMGWMGRLGIGLSVIVPGLVGMAGEPVGEAVRYSTSGPPSGFRGPRPDLDLAVVRTRMPAVGTPGGAAPEVAAAEPKVLEPKAVATEASPAGVAEPEPPRLAATPSLASPTNPGPRPNAPLATKSEAEPEPAIEPSEAPVRTPEPIPDADPIPLAKRIIADARERFRQVRDYTCTLIKRERIEGRLTPYHVLQVKARSRPFSLYMRFTKPNAGREAIYVAGRHGGKVLAHDVGIGKVLAGTLELDPRGDRAMEDSRHPITEAGIGALIETVHARWGIEMVRGETQVTVRTNARVDDRPCVMIESLHPRRRPDYFFHCVRVYVDHELGLPIRFEAYDWPKRPGAPLELLEEYTYVKVKLNVGLREADFDPANEAYSFGRF